MLAPLTRTLQSRGQACKQQPLASWHTQTVEVDGIDSAVASKIYAHAQGQEQAWEEKNRVRGLEHLRAGTKDAPKVEGG